ncbi:hypothetical protein D3C74_467440 [compost metagenome]
MSRIVPITAGVPIGVGILYTLVQGVKSQPRHVAESVLPSDRAAGSIIGQLLDGSSFAIHNAHQSSSTIIVILRLLSQRIGHGLQSSSKVIRELCRVA